MNDGKVGPGASETPEEKFVVRLRTAHGTAERQEILKALWRLRESNVNVETSTTMPGCSLPRDKAKTAIRT